MFGMSQGVQLKVFWPPRLPCVNPPLVAILSEGSFEA